MHDIDPKSFKPCYLTSYSTPMELVYRPLGEVTPEKREKAFIIRPIFENSSLFSLPYSNFGSSDLVGVGLVVYEGDITSKTIGNGLEPLAICTLDGISVSHEIASDFDSAVLKNWLEAGIGFLEHFKRENVMKRNYEMLHEVFAVKDYEFLKKAISVTEGIISIWGLEDRLERVTGKFAKAKDIMKQIDAKEYHFAELFTMVEKTQQIYKGVLKSMGGCALFGCY